VAKPRKRFGQHFLTNPAVIDRIIAAVRVQHGTTLIEIGPGRGALTAGLAEKTEHFAVIEVDRDLAARLATQYTVYTMDVLQFDFSKVLSTGTLHLAGNLPYNISTPLLFHVYNAREWINDMVFMVQKEVADRISATPRTKAYGRLSVVSQAVCEVEKLFDVAPGCFYPPPKVESSVIRLSVRQDRLGFDLAEFSALVKTAFAARRKTLANNLKVLKRATPLPLDGTRRAEELSLEEFFQLFDWYQRP
jgi:16S rRNA (adenine1518-N6/adenine1519-N6)-dimethyltransferase